MVAADLDGILPDLVDMVVEEMHVEILDQHQFLLILLLFNLECLELVVEEEEVALVCLLQLILEVQELYCLNILFHKRRNK